MSGRMNDIFGFEGGFTRICSKIFDLMILSILWVICCIPLITIGDATSALYYAVVKSVKEDNGYAVKEFFRSFKRNFKSAVIIWLILAAFFAAAQMNAFIIMEMMDDFAGMILTGGCLVVSTYAALMALYAFPALSRFDMPVFWILKLSVYMSVRYFLTSIALVMVLFCFGVLVLRVPLLIIIIPGVIAFVMAEFLERILKKHEP